MRLQATRATFAHNGNRGDASESALRSFLRDHLPGVFDVGTGEVIDAIGGRSRQTDVVIATEDHPFKQVEDEPGLFICEGVYALGEVKSRLTTDAVRDASEKAQVAKGLRRTPSVGAEVVSNPSDTARWVDGGLPFFLFAYESAVAEQTLLSRLVGSSIDAVFVLGEGSAIDYGDGGGSWHVRIDAGVGGWVDVTGWAWVAGTPTLVSLLGWLHSLPRIKYRKSPIMPYILGATAQRGIEVTLPHGGNPL
jgi:hypothetical protein